MTEFAKIIIPLLDDNITKEDVSKEAGFVGLYTEDIDNPELGYVYLVYDDTVRTEDSCERAVRFAGFREIVKQYTKIVNSTPLLVYKFWYRPDIKELMSGTIRLNANQKIRILQFWGLDDSFAKTCVSNVAFSHRPTLKIPANDYRMTFYDKWKSLYELGVQQAA